MPEARPSGGAEHRVEVPTVDGATMRSSLGMSQAEFAAAFGGSIGSVCNWELGRRVPRGLARVLLTSLRGNQSLFVEF